MEHLNRRLKSMLRNMGSNVTENSVTLGVKSIGIVQHICQTFLKESGAGATSDHHSIPSFKVDFNLILNTLELNDKKCLFLITIKGIIPVLNFRIICLKVKSIRMLH